MPLFGLELCTKYVVRSMRYKMRGTGCEVRGTRYEVRGTLYEVWGTWYTVLLLGCAADFSLLNLPKGKSLGRSKPATSSYAQAPQHTVWDDFYYIRALLNCLL